MQVPCTVQSLSHFYKFFSVIHHVILPLLIRERQSDFISQFFHASLRYFRAFPGKLSPEFQL